jgi:entericidin B
MPDHSTLEGITAMQSIDHVKSLGSWSRITLRALAAAIVMAFVLQLAACNTVEGAGEDIEEAGDSIQDAAD